MMNIKMLRNRLSKMGINFPATRKLWLTVSAVVLFTTNAWAVANLASHGSQSIPTKQGKIPITTSNLEPSPVKRISHDLGVTLDAFTQCLNTGKMEKQGNAMLACLQQSNKQLTKAQYNQVVERLNERNLDRSKVMGKSSYDL